MIRMKLKHLLSVLLVIFFLGGTSIPKAVGQPIPEPGEVSPRDAGSKKSTPRRTSSRSTKKKDGQDLVEEGLYSCHRGKVRRVSVSFKPEVELKDLITWAMGFTCKNFIFGSNISSRTKVTIIAPKTMTPFQAWRVFLVALRSMNMTIVPTGNVLRIIEASQAKSTSLPLYRKGSPGSGEQLVRVIVRPEHMSVEDTTTALNVLKSKDGQVTAIRNAGVVVVTDYGSHVTKMRYLLAEIDQPASGERLYIIKVRNADVTELATKLQEILGLNERRSSSRSSSSTSSSRSRSRRNNRNQSNQRAAEPAKEVAVAVPSKIMADERINSLIILASKQAYLRVQALVKRLDVAVDVEGAGRIHVYYLENADAEELAGTLSTVISGVSSPSSSSRSRSRSSSRSSRRSSSSSSSSAGSVAFEGQVRVTHDKPSNALVIVASVKDFLALREVIRKLDAPRRQVFIEASIFELNVSSARELGSSFHLGDTVRDGIVVGGVQHGEDLSSLNPLSVATGTGLVGGLIGPLLDSAESILGTGISIPSYGVLLQALASNDNVNVLSSPHILTTDNEEAEISVGQNIPFQSTVAGLSSAAGQAAGGFGFPIGTSVSRQDVALTLKITPHVNASDMVRLELDQEISDVANEDFQGLGPSWSKRTVKTTVVVRDQQTIVIGGLMQEREGFTVSKVPLLGDIPLLGYLFKFTRKSKAKTNLLIMLTPYVIKDQLDIEQIVQEKVRERNEFVRAFTSLNKMKYQQSIDYQRKRGLVAEINHMVEQVEEEAQVLRELDRKLETFPDGPIEYVPDDPAKGSGEENHVPQESESTGNTTVDPRKLGLGTAKEQPDDFSEEKTLVVSKEKSLALSKEKSLALSEEKSVVESPAKESPAKESPVEELPVEELPVEESSAEDAPPTVADRRYKVQRGDSLTKIAELFDTTVAVLTKLNNIKDPSRLEIGRILLIPSESSNSDTDSDTDSE